MAEQPTVQVGVMNEPRLQFIFNGIYKTVDSVVSGEQCAEMSEGKILWKGRMYECIEFFPENAVPGSFELSVVSIGVNFHWERKENQSFRGSLKLIIEHGRITAVNVLPVEEYLLSVISSEMSATASLELLKAHAVISRSWLLSQIEKNKQLKKSAHAFNPCVRTVDDLTLWYEREENVYFDVCADYLCQRFQGFSR